MFNDVYPASACMKPELECWCVKRTECGCCIEPEGRFGVFNDVYPASACMKPELECWCVIRTECGCCIEPEGRFGVFSDVNRDCCLYET